MTTEVAIAQVSPASGFRSQRPADRFMRRLLRINEPDRRGTTQAHRAFRISVVASGIRCLISYLLLPVLVPMLSLSGWLAAPIGIALCVIAVVNGVVSVRRFWRADHRYRWLYTGFIAVVFVFVAIAVVADIARWGVIA